MPALSAMRQQVWRYEKHRLNGGLRSSGNSHQQGKEYGQRSR
jgi:hypothetical protein